MTPKCRVHEISFGYVYIGQFSNHKQNVYCSEIGSKIALRWVGGWVRGIAELDLVSRSPELGLTLPQFQRDIMEASYSR